MDMLTAMKRAAREMPAHANDAPLVFWCGKQHEAKWRATWEPHGVEVCVYEEITTSAAENTAP